MAASRPWFVIAGGGTGGHLYPGLAVAEQVQRLQPDFEVTVFGTRRPIDRQLVESRGHMLVPQEVRPFPRRPWQWPGFLRTWMRSVKTARSIFQERVPSFVLGLGGYAAAPPIVAAARLGIPTAIFNPDAVPGRANRRLGGKVDRVFVQWDETAEHFPHARVVQCTGCPIRAAFSETSRIKGCKALKLDSDQRVLLITGASQGAHSINMAIMQLFDLWRVAADWQIVHLTGEADLEFCKQRYREAKVRARVFAYTEHIAHCMAAADLIVSRAGASTLAEITALGKPSVLIPYPYDRHQHQTANAKVLAGYRAAAHVPDARDPEENAHRLREVLRDLMKSDQRRQRMSQAAGAIGRLDAAQEIAVALFEMARQAR